jgi:ubiquinone/menaquinone biosynthesis C-methylase UbiE
MSALNFIVSYRAAGFGTSGGCLPTSVSSLAKTDNHANQEGSLSMSAEVPHTNPIRGRFNSWLLAKFEDDFHEEVGLHKTKHIGSLAGTIIEIGAGNGVNFRYYPSGVRVVAYEPNPYMHDRLHASARAHGLDVELRPISAESLDFEDDTIDAAVCTLVLCTVPNPIRMISEVRRVLKPGGRFFFIEHVGAESGTFLRRMQDLLHGPWHYVFEGCHTNRETSTLLEEAGFSRLEIERFTSGKMPALVVPQIVGVATK